MVHHKNSASFHEKKDQDSRSKAVLLKLADAQKIIRNKFKKACAKRIESERDVDRAMLPLTATNTSELNSFEHDSFPPNASLAKTHSSRKIKFRKSELNDPNALCSRLKLLLASSKITKRTDEINAIIKHLRDHEILV